MGELMIVCGSCGGLCPTDLYESMYLHGERMLLCPACYRHMTEEDAG